jgi:glucose/arabinose dehydrogenase
VKRVACAVAGFALVVAACTGEDSEAATTTTTTPPPETTAEAPAPTAALPTTTSEAPATTEAASTTITTVPLGELSLALEVVAEGFEQPVFATAIPGDTRLFVVGQPGLIWVIDRGAPEVFLDIRDQVRFGGEMGLLGLAFHPDYAANGLFYVDYVDTETGTRISEFSVGDSGIADRGSERVVLRVPQPATNHNGGMIGFGPDGVLWIGMGDGGGADDQYGNGQRGDTLLASMLRIEVGPGAPDPYGIPDGNDFEAPEVWAIGLRNPWRWDFDGDVLWIGDVGQGNIEEINRVDTSVVGLNFGWSLFEGTSCFRGDCDAAGLVRPVHEYGHDQGCSITGGFVYRGADIPELDGHYFFSDWCTGFLRSITPGGDVIDWTDDVGIQAQVSSFGVDGRGELYLVSATGTVWRLVRGTA